MTESQVGGSVAAVFQRLISLRHEIIDQTLGCGGADGSPLAAVAELAVHLVAAANPLLRKLFRVEIFE